MIAQIVAHRTSRPARKARKATSRSWLAKVTLSPASVLAQSGFNPYNPPNNSYNDPTGKQESGAGIQYSGADMNYASRVVYAEASNNYAEQKAVASVIYNRVASTGYSGGVQYTLRGVCNAP